MPEDTSQNDEDTATAVAVLMAVILIQFSLPFIFYCCAFCMQTYKRRVGLKQMRRRQRELDSEIERCFLEVETAARSKSNDELAKCVQHYYEAVERFNEELKPKPRKGFYWNVGLVRLISLVAYFSFYVWAAVSIVCEVTQCSKYTLSWKYLRFFGFAMLGIAPIIVLVESAFSHELDYISNILEDQSAQDLIHDMHAFIPEVTMKIECYHYETKAKESNPSAGATSSGTERKRVVTFENDYPFTFGCCVDASEKELPPLEQGCLTRIKVDPHIILGDDQTRKEFAEQKQRLVIINKHRDKEISLSVKEEIPGLDKRFSAYADPAAKSWWIRPRYFWLATVLFMSWPYRWVFRAKTSKIHYALMKKIFKRNTPPKEGRTDDGMINDILRRHGRALPGENLELELIEQV